MPCDAENLAWVKASLAKSSPRIKVFDVEEEERAEETESASAGISVDWNDTGLGEMSAVYTHTYARTHSITFFADNMRTALREIIRENGFSPDKLVQDWSSLERGMKAWLESGHLDAVTVEFFVPGTTKVVARWDFPVAYTGSGVDDDMWLDKAYLRGLIAKSERPTNNCLYRVYFSLLPGAPDVAGFSSVTTYEIGHLQPRSAGTTIATGHLTAGVRYWKAA